MVVSFSVLSFASFHALLTGEEGGPLRLPDASRDDFDDPVPNSPPEKLPVPSAAFGQPPPFMKSQPFPDFGKSGKEEDDNDDGASSTFPFNPAFDSHKIEPEYDSRPDYKESGYDSRPVFKEPTFDSGPVFKEPVYDSRPVFKEPTFDSRPVFKEPVFDSRPVFKNGSLTSNPKSPSPPLVGNT